MRVRMRTGHLIDCTARAQVGNVKLPSPPPLQLPPLKMPTLPTLPSLPSPQRQKASDWFAERADWFAERRRAATRLVATAPPPPERSAA